MFLGRATLHALVYGPKGSGLFVARKSGVMENIPANKP